MTPAFTAYTRKATYFQGSIRYIHANDNRAIAIPLTPLPCSYVPNLSPAPDDTTPITLSEALYHLHDRTWIAQVYSLQKDEFINQVHRYRCKRLTQRQAAVLSAYTNTLCGSAEARNEFLTAYTSQRVTDHTFATPTFQRTLSDLLIEEVMLLNLDTEQAAILSAYTGFSLCPMQTMQGYADSLFKRPTLVHEYASHSFCEQLRQLSQPDFFAITNTDS